MNKTRRRKQRARANEIIGVPGFLARVIGIYGRRASDHRPHPKPTRRMRQRQISRESRWQKFARMSGHYMAGMPTLVQMRDQLLNAYSPDIMDAVNADNERMTGTEAHTIIVDDIAAPTTDERRANYRKWVTQTDNTPRPDHWDSPPKR